MCAKINMIFVCLCLGGFAACSVKVDYAQDFAENVSCAKGYNGACWCFVSSGRTTGSTGSTKIGMTLAPDDFCVKRLDRYFSPVQKLFKVRRTSIARQRGPGSGGAWRRDKGKGE